MNRKERYFHLGEKELFLTRTVASLARWVAGVGFVVAGVKIVLRALAWMTFAPLFAELFLRLLGEHPDPHSFSFTAFLALLSLAQMAMVFLPVLYLWKFGGALRRELDSPNEVMRMTRPMELLRRLLIILLIESVLLWFIL